MVTLNILDSTTVIELVLVVLALAFSFLAIRKSGFLWLPACAAWCGVVAYWSIAWIQIVAVIAAVLSIAFFTASLSGAKVKRG